MEPQEKNCTTVFMTAPLGIAKVDLFENSFIGAYIGDVQKSETEYKRGIYVLFRPKDMLTFEQFLYNERERGATVVEDYDYEGGYVVVIYILKPDFANDYEKFLKGNYSKFSMQFRATFPEKIHIDGTDQVTLQQRVFTKDESIREYWEELIGTRIEDGSEVYSSPNVEIGSEEWLDISKFKK